MNSNILNSTNNLASAENYYNAMKEKNFTQMAIYLHKNVQLVSPLAQIHGKEAVVIAAENFGKILQDIKIRAKFAAGPQIMLAYNMTLPEPIGNFPAAVLMDFLDNLIVKIELFYDPGPILRK